jgi:hypothetical protein
MSAINKKKFGDTGGGIEDRGEGNLGKSHSRSLSSLFCNMISLDRQWIAMAAM